MAINYADYSGSTPNDYYNELAQAFVDASWDNTAAKAPENGGQILEQVAIGSNDYCCIDAWVKTTVGDVTTGAKDSFDFIKMYFRDIRHECVRGQYYRFDDSYWIVNDYSHFNGIAQDVGLRRCNNFLRIVDPLNGGVFTIPCVVDYDMSAPSTQVGRYIITPNNHAVVKVQGNDDTLRLFKTNTRYILGGRPFKLYAYQNALNYTLTYDKPTYIELDLYLDELHDGDDIENAVANNGVYDYSIAINAAELIAAEGDSGRLATTVMLNGDEVERPIVWHTSNRHVVSVSPQGKYVIMGQVGDTATITAHLEGNSEVKAEVAVSVQEQAVPSAQIVLLEEFTKIRQNETITFKVGIDLNGELVNAIDTEVKIAPSDNQYLSISSSGDTYAITCLKPSPNPVGIVISAKMANNPDMVVGDKLIQVTAVSMFG